MSAANKSQPNGSQVVASIVEQLRELPGEVVPWP